jgi:imidazolonepropionase
MEEWLANPKISKFDAGGRLVTPGLIDPHTHPIFAGERCEEFDLKAQGRSYLEIHKAGGGIQSTVNATRAASKDQLVDNGSLQFDRLLRWGITTIEAKSGYALTVDGELRLLKVLQQLDGCHAIDVMPSLLGAHTIPLEHKGDRESYIRQIIEQMIPQAAAEKLAQFCDAYCEDGAFSTDEVARIFDAAKKHGLKLRLHAEQFTDQGGSVLAAKMGATSVDHLEAISAESIRALGESETVAVLLPGAALTCKSAMPPASELFAAGIPVALGTDLNPGSSMTASLPLMMSLACMQMGFSCDQAWQAVTRVAAQSLARPDIGHLGKSAIADLAIFDAPDYRYIPYHYGENHCSAVIKRGRVVFG